MTIKKEKPVHEADGIRFDSREELEFYYWLLILQYYGMISGFVYHPQSFELAAKQTYTVEVRNRRGVKQVEKHLLNNCEYTPDFKVVPGNGFDTLKIGWHTGADGNYWIDVKGNFSIHNDARYFSVMQKWMYCKFDIYINKVIPQDLFKKTFVPRKAAFNRDGSRRKCYYGCRFYKEYNQSHGSLI